MYEPLMSPQQQESHQPPLSPASEPLLPGPPTIIAPPALDPSSTSSSASTTPHKKRRVQWVGLRERDSTELDDWPSSSSHQSHPQPLLSPPNHKSSTGTDPTTSSLSDHQHHLLQPSSLTPSSSTSFSRPFSIRLPDRPTLEQLSQQIASQHARTARRHLVHHEQDSDSRDNSTSSLALSTNLNTRANSSTVCAIPISNNPYFPSILPQPIQPVEPSTNLNKYRNNLLRSQSSRLASKQPTLYPQEAYLPTPTTPMATPDQSRPATPDSDLDIVSICFSSSSIALMFSSFPCRLISSIVTIREMSLLSLIITIIIYLYIYIYQNKPIEIPPPPQKKNQQDAQCPLLLGYLVCH
ncbi:hypothetical protein PGTUg99_022069 [Puccinia graminis f. sp. tritici]|uniref:Uncharacterized protein n=1 Tax=Puccinia graminis f. sp. tritici TaxID=56615 RepID=A0A5B0MF88_PUCGR|nr:hypothetical protein PGTUg99_022069 [Puccinia graminis f. sp. tritici]